MAPDAPAQIWELCRGGTVRQTHSRKWQNTFGLCVQTLNFQFPAMIYEDLMYALELTLNFTSEFQMSDHNFSAEKDLRCIDCGNKFIRIHKPCCRAFPDWASLPARL